MWALLDRFGNVRGWGLAQVAVLYGLVILGFATAEVTFWTVQSLELFAIVSNGSVDAGSYPATVYRRFMRRFYGARRRAKTSRTQRPKCADGAVHSLVTG